MDIKRAAMVVGIIVLLPLFIGLFFDAIYQAPKYEDFCNNSMYSAPMAAPAKLNPNCNCSITCDYNYGKDYEKCVNSKGNANFKYDSNGCQIYESCDYCSVHFNDAQSLYNRNLFFIIAPVGLAMIILGIYISVNYIAAGLMFGGIITMFYATMRYFSEMSKLLRALVILAELLVIIWIGYKKIGLDNGKKPSKARKKAKK